MKCTYLILTVAVSAVVSGCDAKTTPATEKRVASVPQLAAHGPTVSIDGPVFTVNGKKVWLGEKLDRWKATLPGEARCIMGDRVITLCIWDELGISVGTGEFDKSRTEFINVDLVLPRMVYGVTESEFIPRKAFAGSLRLDGFPISTDTEFRSIVKKVPRRRQLRCGGRDCSNPGGNFEDVGMIKLHLSSSTDRGTVENFSVACAELELCVGIVPAAAN